MASERRTGRELALAVFRQEFVVEHRPRCSGTGQNRAAKAVASTKWTYTVQRGGCLLSQRLVHRQRAGQRAGRVEALRRNQFGSGPG